jgi:hypothetical protein
MPLLRSNPKHEAFARHRALLVDVLEAYKLAGYTKGSELYQRGNARKLDQNPKIRARIVELTKESEEDIAIESYRMRRELRRIGYANAAELWEWNGDRLVLKDLTRLPAEVQATIGEIAVEPIIEYEGTGDERRKVVGGQKIKIKHHSKLEALLQLAKLLGLAKDEVASASASATAIVMQVVSGVPRAPDDAREDAGPARISGAIEPAECAS